VLGARDQALAREKQLYEEVLTQLIDCLGPLQTTAGALGELDAAHQPGRARACSMARARALREQQLRGLQSLELGGERPGAPHPAAP